MGVCESLHWIWNTRSDSIICVLLFHGVKWRLDMIRIFSEIISEDILNGNLLTLHMKGDILLVLGMR